MYPSGRVGPDLLADARLKFALAELERVGALTGTRSRKVSARIDPGLIETARRAGRAFAANPI